MKKLLCILLLFALIFTSCDVGEVVDESYVIDEPTVEETVYVANNSVFGIAYAPGESADPYTSPNKLNTELVWLICDPLFELGENFLPTPVLCSEYTYSDKTLTLKIKGGVTFSDGSKLTAADVKYSLDCAMAEGSFYATRLSVIENIGYSTRNGTVTIKLRYDNARIASILDIPVIKKGTRGNLFPTGTGIYAPDNELKMLIAREGHHTGKTPYYKTLLLHAVSSSDELVYEFDNKNISLITNDPTGSNPLRPSIMMDVKSVPTTQMHFIGFNRNSPALADASVRKAIAKAIDRESAATSDFALMGRASALPLHPSVPEYPKDIADMLSYEKDTPVSVSAPLTILVNSENSGKLAVCKRISETLTRLGAPTTVRALPFEEYTAALQAGDFTLYYGEISLGADFDLSRLLSGSLNLGGVLDETLISAHSAYLSGDEAKRDFYTQFCNTVPFAPIMFKDTTVCTEKNFFLNFTPLSHNPYHGFCDWTIGG